MIRALAFAASVLSAATLPLPAAAQDKVTLLLDWFVNPNHAPIILAEELGYFAEQGLEVEVIAPADPSAPPKTVAAGRADLAISYQPQLHLQVAEGLPLVRVGTLVATPLNCLLVRADSDIEEVADLAGRRVGFSVAGVEEALLQQLLAGAGLGLGDIEMVNVNFSLSPALMAGQVDAVIGAYRNFELTQMELEGVPGRCLYLEELGIPSFDELIYIANPQRMDAGRIARFLAATELAVQHMVNDPEGSWAVFSGTAPELQDELNARAFTDTLPRFSLTPAGFDHGRYARFETFLAEAGLLDETRPVSELAVDVGAILEGR